MEAELGARSPYPSLFIQTNMLSMAEALRATNGVPLNILSREGFCRNPRGISPNKFLGEFCGGFLRGFFGGFCRLENIPSKSPLQDSNQNLGVTPTKSTLQGSALGILLVTGQGRLLVDFGGLFLGKENPSKHPQQNSNQNLGGTWTNSTLQESALVHTSLPLFAEVIPLYAPNPTSRHPPLPALF